MRIDNSLNRDNLNQQQLFFVECWSSLTGRNNIDSDRVTYNNPLSAVAELIDIYALGDKFSADKKRVHITTELNELLKQDVSLKDPKFHNIPEQILGLFPLDEAGNVNFSILEKNKTLVLSFLNQLKFLLEKYYISVIVEKLRYLLITQNIFNDDVCSDIYYHTNMLIGTLLTMGMPLSECYMLYKSFLMKRQKEVGGEFKNISFEKSFDKLMEKVSQGNQDITISLKLVSKKLFSLIKNSKESVRFQKCEFVLIEHPKENNVAVNIKVEAISFSAAHAKATLYLNNALAVIAYMMNREEVSIEKKYTATTLNDKGNQVVKELYDYSQGLNSSSDRLGIDEFNLYIKTISRLHDINDDSTVSKISAAFKFYQNGNTNHVTESKFTAFWSALEALTLGVYDESMSHDQHVMKSVLPCIGLDYTIKQLFALRGVAKNLNWDPINANGLEIDYKFENLGGIYKSLKSEEHRNEIYLRLNNYPYALFRFKQFISICNCPYKVGIKIQNHLKKVELQIHRLYRVRNAIVHNASVQDRLEMLVVNLEHYLRGTLNAMIYMMSDAQSISSPEEAFNRYQHKYNEIIGSLDPSSMLGGRKKEQKIKDLENQLRQENPNFERIGNDDKLLEWLSMHN
ncbi:hypothetical protein MCT08_11825 [Vibrio aestuarianus]|uniref:hypothetical protein n=1 Tax=Vibrio aestuarianus TaxID=28171 RepID=UPI00237C5B24|nr:hypothetical protein [Vibrio aestuarianus]MDE1250284.1 hypothetical protein [Vibrio aestuarianus]